MTTFSFIYLSATVHEKNSFTSKAKLVTSFFVPWDNFSSLVTGYTDTISFLRAELFWQMKLTIVLLHFLVCSLLPWPEFVNETNGTKRVVSVSKYTEPEPRAALGVAVQQTDVEGPAITFRSTLRVWRVGVGRGRSCLILMSVLDIEVREREKETCSFGNPGSLQMAVSAWTCLKTCLCPLPWFLTKLAKFTQLLLRWHSLQNECCFLPKLDVCLLACKSVE